MRENIRNHIWTLVNLISLGWIIPEIIFEFFLWDVLLYIVVSLNNSGKVSSYDYI